MSKYQNTPKYRFLKKKSPKISIPNLNEILFTYLHRQYLLVNQTHAGVQEVSSFRVCVNLRVRYVYPVVSRFKSFNREISKIHKVQISLLAEICSFQNQVDNFRTPTKDDSRYRLYRVISNFQLDQNTIYNREV